MMVNYKQYTTINIIFILLGFCKFIQLFKGKILYMNCLRSLVSRVLTSCAGGLDLIPEQ